MGEGLSTTQRVLNSLVDLYWSKHDLIEEVIVGVVAAVPIFSMTGCASTQESPTTLPTPAQKTPSTEPPLADDRADNVDCGRYRYFEDWDLSIVDASQENGGADGVPVKFKLGKYPHISRACSLFKEARVVGFLDVLDSQGQREVSSAKLTLTRAISVRNQWRRGLHMTIDRPANAVCGGTYLLRLAGLIVLENEAFMVNSGTYAGPIHFGPTEQCQTAP